jgi:AcrR family transcriptional regulator
MKFALSAKIYCTECIIQGVICLSSSRNPEPQPGLRERKREETLRRIADTGVRLFMAQGFAATTVDEIAAKAGISRRTFFHYFKSKDDILVSLGGGRSGEQLAAHLAERRIAGPPLEAVRRAVLDLLTQYPRRELQAMDKLMRSSEIVQARKMASYAQDEEVLHDALCDIWPQESAPAMRVLAMMSVGAIRLSLATWAREGYARPIEDIVNEAFDAIKSVGD